MGYTRPHLEQTLGLIVTAVLLDFRAWDTLGEATVLFCAALGTVAVLRRKARIKPGQAEEDES